MDVNLFLGVAVALIVLFFLMKLFSGKLKHVGVLLLRALVAFFGIWAVNIVGGFFGFHVGLNLLTAFTLGLLGIPGAALILAVKYFI